MNAGDVIFKFKGDDTDLNKKTNGLASSMGKAASTIGKSFVVAGAAVGGLVAAGVKGYADLEQSVGGIETLFGTQGQTLDDLKKKYMDLGNSESTSMLAAKADMEAHNKVIEDAKQAYKTTGLSANEYMENVTGFAAALNQSLGSVAESANFANMAMVDMADNSNKMGTDMSTIQTAYQGFAKQNFTMLDNLKLGYGGTKTEMERLLADAQKISGVEYDTSNFADIVEAIHVVQDEMGITGTTAKESSTTIIGSMASAKSAFTNFISGSGGIEDVITTFVTAGTNIGAAIVKIAPNIATGLVQLVNSLIPQIAPLLQALLPSVITGAGQLLMGLVQAFPTIVKILMDMLPTVITMLADMLPEITTALINGLILVILTLAQQMPILIPQIVDAILTIIPILIDNLPLFVSAGWQLISGIAVGIFNAWPSLMAKLPGLVGKMASAFGKIVDKMLGIGGDLVKGLWQGIKNATGWVMDKIKGFGNSILKGIKGIFGIHSPSTEFAWVGKMNAEGLIKGMEGMENEVQQSFDGMFDLSPQLYGSSAMNMSPKVNIVVNNNMKQDALGQMVNDVKTFSGGSKNDYNYGYGGA